MQQNIAGALLPLTIISKEEDPIHWESLIEEVGDAEDPPPEPSGGIPKQIIPGWIRWPIRYLFLPFVLLDLAAQRLAKWIIPPPFKQVGSCKRRGNCCHYILIRHSKGLGNWLYLFWNTQINGFYFRSRHPQEYDKDKVYVMGCRYLKKDGSCAHYRLRPMVCRKWPMIEYFAHPKILKGCGFTWINKN